MKEIEIAADPACPWSGLAMHWLAQVAPARDLRIRLRPYSLWLRDGDRPPTGVPDFIAALAVETSRQSLRVTRVFTALQADGRDDAVVPLYLAWTAHVFPPGRPPQAPTPATLTEALAATALPHTYLTAADDPTRDDLIRTAMTTLETLTNAPSVVPTLLTDNRLLTQGALLTAPTTPTQALPLWDAFALLATTPTFAPFSPTPTPLPACG
ncbi:hypothetical protein HPO96_24050 [Kribbella sandramycini]|uniref:DSBA-like thioredoxin domain-containing protein n=1 Tax=Kribbella sandramycini TaxID=60450 RepID=A0A7Y4P1V8_9ACTN|nr:hypothetical protein [Kribbella sandramycini]MBB6571273.1 hypothetical protein [Kribbella sandramycini]NOL43323.1 hypothetical protein [Kribbella sandramycini]